MHDPMLPLPGLSSVAGKRVEVRFDGGRLSSDGGLLALREIEGRLRVADRLAACMVDPRAPDQITHGLADIIRFRLLMIGAGYEDGNDANSLRGDPMFKMALDLSPSDRELCSQSTISRLENLPDVRALSRMGRAMVDLYCESFAKVPKRITLDIDDTFDAVHGGQQLRLFNAHHEYGFQPIVVFDGEGRFVTAVLRPAKRRSGKEIKRPSGKEIKSFLRRLLRAIRANWPNTAILLRADSHYCAPEVLDWCRANGLDYILGVAPTTTLRRRVEGLEASTKARFEAAPRDGKLRRFKEFLDGAQSWSRVERIIARVEVGAEGADTRFVVTNLSKSNARVLFQASQAASMMASKVSKTRLESQLARWREGIARSVRPGSIRERARAAGSRCIGGDVELVRRVPSGAVEYEHGMSSLGDVTRDFLEVELHGLGVGEGQRESGAVRRARDRSRRTDRRSRSADRRVGAAAFRSRPIAGADRSSARSGLRPGTRFRASPPP
jgi:hypothetical protein